MRISQHRNIQLLLLISFPDQPILLISSLVDVLEPQVQTEREDYD